MRDQGGTYLKVALIAATYFTIPGVDLMDELMPGTYFDNPSANHSNAEALVEFAGRNCYQSFENKSGKTNKEYIENILAHGHGSVLEHSSATFFLEGVSRSLTHELIRHRHLSFSELSQRFVKMDEAATVVPPALRDAGVEDLGFGPIKERYGALRDFLQSRGKTRKEACEAARCVLPNAMETRIVVTGNFRAWRYFIEARATEHADAEIRELAFEICRQLQERFPNVFGDFVMDGESKTCSTSYRSV